MSSTVTLWRELCAIKTLDVTDGAVYIGRHEAIRKRKLNERDTQIPRRAARLEVAPEHVGTLLLSNPHRQADLQVTLPDGAQFTLRPNEAMPVPSDVVLWGDVKMTYSFARPSIYSQDTDDGDQTEEEEELAGEAQPREDWLETQLSQ